jgi:hypothetical protein
MKAAAFPARPHRAPVLLHRLATLGASILLAGMAGCGGKKTTGPGPQPQPKYLPSSTPANVLINMRIAYSTRDSSGYDSLFDAAYTGTSDDHSGPSPVVYTFTKADEARHISALAQATTITDIYLVLMPVLIRYTDAGDPPGWAVIQDPVYILSITDGINTYLIARDRETIEFRFKPTTPSPGSPTDTTWHIVRWTEVVP